MIVATVVVNGGRAIIANRMLGLGTEPKYAHWGTGSGTAGVSDTGLYSPAEEARVAGTSSRVLGPAPNVPNDTYQVIATLTAVAGKTITNAGLFDDPTTGALFMKGDFQGIVLATGEGIQFTFQCQFK
jgi:hypothetical protein